MELSTIVMTTKSGCILDEILQLDEMMMSFLKDLNILKTKIAFRCPKFVGHLFEYRVGTQKITKNETEKAFSA